MSRLRVISGTARGRRLQLVPGEGTRPISDRAKEALFNILGPDVIGCGFLDLFAGTGSVGIEALSREAGYVRFVEKDRRALPIVRANLVHTRLAENAEVLHADAFTVLGRHPDKRFDYVYVAPPQYKGLWKKAMLALDARPDWVVNDGWVIAQIDPLEYEALALAHFSEFEQRRYGNTLLVFFERVEANDD